MSNDLDRMLANPLPLIADDGFSERLALRLQREHSRRGRIEMFALAGVAAAICLVMPFTSLGQHVNSWVLQTVDMASLPLAIVAATLVAAAALAGVLSEDLR